MTAEGLATAAAPPEYVNGVSLTPGGVGLALTFHAELTRIAACRTSPLPFAVRSPPELRSPAGDAARLFVVAEDDASFVGDFGARFAEAVAVLDAYDGGWDFLQIGYFGDDRTFAKPEITDAAVRRVLAVPESVAGTAGIAMRPNGARSLLACLFPVPPPRRRLPRPSPSEARRRRRSTGSSTRRSATRTGRRAPT